MKLLLVVFLLTVVHSEFGFCQNVSKDAMLDTFHGAIVLAKNLPKAIEALLQTRVTKELKVLDQMADLVLASLEASLQTINELMSNANTHGDAQTNEENAIFRATVSSLAIAVVQLQTTIDEVQVQGLTEDLNVRLGLLEQIIKEKIFEVDTKILKTV